MSTNQTWKPLPDEDCWLVALYGAGDRIIRVHPIGFTTLREALRAVDRLNAALQTP